MKPRTRELVDAASVERVGGRYDGWTVGRIVLEAQDPVAELRAIVAFGDERQATAARRFLTELQRFETVRQIAAAHGATTTSEATR